MREYLFNRESGIMYGWTTVKAKGRSYVQSGAVMHETPAGNFIWVWPIGRWHLITYKEI